MAWTQVGNIGAPGWAGEVVSTTGGTFTGSFPTGLFSKPPIVVGTAFGGAANVSITAKTATGFTGTVISLGSLAGLIGVTVGVIARPAS